MVTVSINPFKSVVVMDENGKDLRVDEGRKISFANKDGEQVDGTLDKISGKNEKVKFLITPPDSSKQELWRLADIQEGSLRIL
jgi:hypothetical protein